MRKAILLLIALALTGAACSTTSTTPGTAVSENETQEQTTGASTQPISDAEFASNSEVLGPTNQAEGSEGDSQEGDKGEGTSPGYVDGTDAWATPVSTEPRPEGTDLDPNQATDNQNLFQNTTAGFTIQKPQSWNFLSAQMIAANRENIRLQDENMEQLIREKASAPLVAMAKYPEPYDDLNPGVQVMVRPLGPLANTPPTEILQMTAVQLQNAFADFSVVEDVHETTVDGLQAAYMKIKYTVANAEGRQFPTLTRMWLIPRGEYMFTVGMSGPQDGPNVAEGEFQEIFDSIRIEKQ